MSSDFNLIAMVGHYLLVEEITDILMNLMNHSSFGERFS